MRTPTLEDSRFPLPGASTRAGFSAKPDKSPESPGKGPPEGPLTCYFELGGRDSNPEWQGQNLQCCRLHHPRTGASEDSGSGAEGLLLGEGEALLDPDEAAETYDPGDADLGGLRDHVAELRQARDGAGAGR
jgi:hypothetical protein